MSELDREGRWWSVELNRRTLLRGGVLGGAGLAAAALIGCGGDDDDDDDTAATTTTTTSGSGSTSGSGTSSNITSQTQAGQTQSTSGDDDDAATTSGDDEDYSIGMLVRDENLPYPFQFPEPNKKPVAGGRMQVAATYRVQNFDPTTSAAGGTITVPNHVYNRLIGFKGGPHNNPYEIVLEPELASSWERTPDGQVFTFNLRDDVSWQNLPPLNGRKFVADDVKFAYDRYAAEGVHKSYWRNISSTEAPDDTTFKATMGTVTADFILPLASRYQTIFPREPVDAGNLDTVVVGTGSMILTEAVDGSHIAFDKNPDYWENEVLLDGVDVRLITDQTARVAAFRVGQLDYGYSVASTLKDLNKLLETNPDIQVNLTVVVNGGIPFGMNLSHPKFQDERIRQAMTLAMDTDFMEEVVYDNLAKTLPLHPWPFVLDQEPQKGDPALGPWFSRYDPEEAKKLLAAAGADELAIDGIYYRYADYFAEITEITTEQFRQVGIGLDSRSVDYTEFNSSWVPAKLEEATTSGWLTVGFDGDNYFYNSVHSASPGNRWQLNDPQVDAWAEAQQTELDPDARKEIHRQMWDYFLQKMFWPPVPSGLGLQIYQPWLRGIRFGGLFGTNSSYYDWGDQVHAAWIDPDIDGRA